MSKAAERHKSESCISTNARVNLAAISGNESHNVLRRTSSFGACLDKVETSCPSRHDNNSDLSPRCEFDIVGVFKNIATVTDMNTTHIRRKKNHSSLVVDNTHDDGTIEKSVSCPPPRFSYDIAEVFKNLATVTDMKTSNISTLSC